MFPHKVWLSIISMVTALILVGCNGSDSTTSPPPPPPPPPPNEVTINVSLDSLQVISGGAATGSATADLTVNLDDNTIEGAVTLVNFTADAVTINQAFAGVTGDVVFDLQQDNATTWSLPVTALTSDMLAIFNSGEFYVKANNATDGAIRGQVIAGDIQLIFTNLSGSQEVPAVTTTGSAIGAITLNPDTGAIVAHLNAIGLDDAVASHLHDGLAGLNGPVSIGLTQDATALGHWSVTGEVLDSAQMASLNKGAFYFNLHTPAEPGGEVRGQVVPGGVEVLFTTLSGDDVVLPVITSNSGIAATTIVSGSTIIDVHVNLQGLDDADSVTINQAPIAQNGPVAYSLTQDVDNLLHWSLDNTTLTDSQEAALSNQGLYLSVASPLEPNGELRGQLEPEMSTPGSSTTFTVSAVVPANGVTVEAVPASIVVTFNRDVLAASVSLDQIELLASGDEDGGFSDGNEVTVTAANATASGDSLTIDLSGVVNADEVYQLTLGDSSAGPITDTNGVVLDGDVDDSPGGDFISTFTVTAPPTPPPPPPPPPPAVTLSELKTEIFTPKCAFSGCHDAVGPEEGMSLTAAQIFSNIVNVNSAQQSNLKRVMPFEPDNSYLIHKIEGRNTISFSQMPLTGAKLTSAEIQKIRDWISDGAQDN